MLIQSQVLKETDQIVKLKISYDCGPFQHVEWLHMGAIISAAGKHKPKVTLVAPGLLIYAAQSLLHSLRGLVQK